MLAASIFMTVHSYSTILATHMIRKNMLKDIKLLEKYNIKKINIPLETKTEQVEIKNFAILPYELSVSTVKQNCTYVTYGGKKLILEDPQSEKTFKICGKYLPTIYSNTLYCTETHIFNSLNQAIKHSTPLVLIYAELVLGITGINVLRN